MYKLGNDVMKYASDFPVIGLNGYKGRFYFNPNFHCGFQRKIVKFESSR